jgi:hypothetical protein
MAKKRDQKILQTKTVDKARNPKSQKMLKEYFRALRNADGQILRQVDGFNSQVKAITIFQFIVSGIMVITGIVLGVVSLRVVLALSDPTSKKDFAYLTFGVGLLLIILAFPNNPGKRLRQNLKSTLQMNVVLLGFLRQINEIEAAYLNSFTNDIDASKEPLVNDAVKHVREAIERTSVEFEQMDIGE